MIHDIVASDVTVYKTQDYGRFSLDPANRPIMPNHVSRMAKAMEANNWLKVCPIIVSSNYVIHDGQHRYRAAVMAGVEVYYIIADDIDIRDVAQMNRLTESWDVYDWLNYWVIYGKLPDYIALQEYLQKFPLITLSAAMFICAESHRYGLYEIFREGLWEYGDVELADEVGNIMNIIADKMNSKINQSFSRAIKKVVSHPEYDGQRMREKLEAIADSPNVWIHNVTTQNEAILLLQNIFNYNMRKDRVAFLRP